ncbi:MAG: TIGR02452 family protein [Deltaproteobacteria bacterium]|nr:TIGR02452 family protein [Deltaproteobacteria bacterium]
MSLAGVAKHTLAIVADRGYVAPSGARRDLGPALDRAIGGTRLYRPAELRALVDAPGRGGGAPTIEVTAETTCAAARRLAATGPVLALDFASAKNPGGGFLGGARAQEEDLARCSALYTCQLTARAYYDANRACDSMLYTDHVIYSPAVPFFRDDRLDLLEHPYLCAVITAPAPNAGEALRRDPRAHAAIAETLARRAAMVLAVAAAHGERRLVLGAWGCGVFRNEPVAVSAVFASLLASPRFAGAFDHVAFAIFSRGAAQPTLAAFRARFAPAS